MREWYKVTVIPGENHRTICGTLDTTPKDWFYQYDKERIESWGSGQDFAQYVSDDFCRHGVCIGIAKVSRRSDEYLKKEIARGEEHIKSMQDMVDGYKAELKIEYTEHEMV